MKRVMLTILVLASGAGCKRESTQAPPPGPTPDPTAEAADANPAEPQMVPVTWPRGDATAGRAAFIAHKCYGCHIVMLDEELSDMHRKAREQAKADAEHAGHGGHAGHEGHAGHGADPGSDHNLPPPLNAATTNKPGMILARQIVMPGDDPADHAVHYGAYADSLTLGELTDIVAFLTQVARSEIAKPDEMPADDIDLVWPKGDIAAGQADVDSTGCASCHGAPASKGATSVAVLAPVARPALLVVRTIAMAHPEHTGKLTIHQLTDLAAALGAR